MRLGLRELWRKPVRFVAAFLALSLLTLLLLVLGGILDGLYLGSTGALRAQPGALVTFSADARDQVTRSRLSPQTIALVRSTPGVQQVGGLGVSQVGMQVPGRDDLIGAAVIGYQEAGTGIPAPPATKGEAYADRALSRSGVEVGQTVGVGPQRLPLRIIGFVDDASFQQQGGLWVSAETWREVSTSVRPDAPLSDGTFQALSVSVAPGFDVAGTAQNIDHVTGGATRTITRDAALQAIPGLKEQNSTFSSIIFVTLFVAGIVVALFFALLTLERTRMYAVFKAIGGSSRQIFTSVVTQAAAIAVVAFLLGGVVALALTPLLVNGLQIPLVLVPGRALFTLVGLVVMAVLGSAITLRRVIRIEPASAIG